jgi:oxygen-independent coproporphyrinogen-3 oxidase
MDQLTDTSGLPVLPALPEPVEGNYFVAAYPPFACWSRDANPEVEACLQSAPANFPALGLYVHIPFCAQRCDYCYYRSYSGRDRHEWDDYTAALASELAQYRATAYLSGRDVHFVYFGGGTPSLLTAGQIARLLRALQQQFPWDGATEVTFECAPRSINAEKLAVLRQQGVMRVSLGVQQFDDRVLRQNGRVHMIAEVFRAYDAIRQAGFDNVNIDLMVGLLAETDETFFGSVEQAIEREADSVTVYQLEIPRNTPLYRSLQDGTLSLPPASWTTKRDRLRTAFTMLNHGGYTLRSAYTAVKDPQRHRFDYQDEQYRGCDLLGIGTSSFSYLGGIHFQKIADMEPYISAVQEGHFPHFRAYALRAEEQMVREFVLQLKLGRAEHDYFHRKFGVSIADDFQAPLAAAQARGWLTLEAGDVVLTREGLLRVDRMLPMFYLPDHGQTGLTLFATLSEEKRSRFRRPS